MHLLSKIILIQFLLCSFNYAATEIIEVNSIEDIPFDEFSRDDCVAFDLDDTVFTQKQKIMRNANFEARKDFLSSIRKQSGNERVSFVYDSSEYQLVEEALIDKLKELNVRGITNFGFTARRTGKATLDQKLFVEDDTLQILNKLEIRFKSDHFETMVLEGMNPNNPEYSEFIIDNRLKPFVNPHDVMVKDTVIFTNNIDKGLVLGKIFDQSSFFPKTFVFIDDKMKNHTSVEEAINKINQRFNQNIKFKGYFYTRVSSMDNQLDPDVVEFQRSAILQEEPWFPLDEEAEKSLMIDEQ